MELSRALELIGVDGVDDSERREAIRVASEFVVEVAVPSISRSSAFSSHAELVEMAGTDVVVQLMQRDRPLATVRNPEGYLRTIVHKRAMKRLVAKQDESKMFEEQHRDDKRTVDAWLSVVHAGTVAGQQAGGEAVEVAPKAVVGDAEPEEWVQETSGYVRRRLVPLVSKRSDKRETMARAVEWLTELYEGGATVEELHAREAKRSGANPNDPAAVKRAKERFDKNCKRTFSDLEALLDRADVEELAALSELERALLDEFVARVLRRRKKS